MLPESQCYLACGAGGGTCNTCQHGVICRVAQECTDEIDVAAQFFIRVSSAEVNPNPEGGTWDAGGELPDVYVCFSDGSASGCTTIVANTASPTWNADDGLLEDGGMPVTFSGAAIVAGSLTFQVYDSDLIIDDLIANGVYSAGIFAKELLFNISDFGELMSLQWSLD